MKRCFSSVSIIYTTLYTIERGLRTLRGRRPSTKFCALCGSCITKHISQAITCIRCTPVCGGDVPCIQTKTHPGGFVQRRSILAPAPIKDVVLSSITCWKKQPNNHKDNDTNNECKRKQHFTNVFVIRTITIRV